jgi:spermidine/putrescine transport system substrate-binding protein
MRSGDAWMTMCWTGDGKQLNNDMPEIEYVLGAEGGELWSDFYAIPKGAPHTRRRLRADRLPGHPRGGGEGSAGAWLSGGGQRVNALLPQELLNDPILYPAQSFSMRWSSGRPPR